MTRALIMSKGASSLKNRWAERISKAIAYLRSTLFKFDNDSFGYSGGSLSFHHPVLRFLAETGAIEQVGRTTKIKGSPLGEKAVDTMSARRVSRPTNRVVYRLYPDRLDQVGSWAANNPPIVVRKGELTLQSEDFPFADFRWKEAPGGIDTRKR